MFLTLLQLNLEENNPILTADAGTFTLTGNDVGLLAGRRVVAEPASFVLTGNDVELQVAKKVVADTGSFVFTGNSAGLRISRTLALETGVFLFSGQDVGLRKSRTLIASPGTFIFSGQPVNLIVFPTQFEGLKYFHNTIRELSLVAVEDAPAGDRITIYKDGVEYAIYLVDTDDPFASTMRINTRDGIKAIRLKT